MHRRLALFTAAVALACVGLGCGRGESQPEPVLGAARGAAATGAATGTGARQSEDESAAPASQPAGGDPAGRAYYTLPSATEEVWPSVPRGRTEEGWVWQTLRHQTIHVHLALPPTYRVELGTDPNQFPVIRLHGPGAELEVSYSSGTARFVTTGEMPPSVTQVRRVESEQNVAMAYDDAQGRRRVGSWTRAAHCELLRATESNQDEAFRVCQSMRHPPPGALLAPRTADPATSAAAWLPQPEHATVDHVGGLRRMFTGHFRVQVNPRGPCPPLETLAERYGPDLEARPIALAHGPALQGQLYERLVDLRWPAGVVVWATRGGQCCTATIPGVPAPTDAQVTYVAEICDALGQESRSSSERTAG